MWIKFLNEAYKEYNPRYPKLYQRKAKKIKANRQA